MKNLKARDHFSAYFEGTLEPGLKESFERTLAQDATVSAEYRAFVKTVKAINALQDQEIEVPFNLHERISARLDHSEWEAKQNRKTSWLSNIWRPATLVGVACLAIFGTIFSMLNRGGGQMGQAGLLPGLESGKPQLSISGDKLFVNADSNGNATLQVRDLVGEKLVSEIPLTSRVHAPLVNSSEKAVILEIKDSKTWKSVLVALPGRQSDVATSGSGSIRDLALAASDHFGTPVQIESTDLNAKVNWKFSSDSADHAPESVFDLKGLVFLHKDNMLTLKFSATK